MKSPAVRQNDVEGCVRAIARAQPFDAWPDESVLRLARSSRVTSCRAGALIQAHGTTPDTIVVIASGSIQASAQNLGGKRYTFALVSGEAEHGVGVLLGSIGVLAEDGRIFNRSFVFDETGQIAGRYDKLHLFDIDLGADGKFQESATIAPAALPR